jgi:hypothetical protein
MASVLGAAVPFASRAADVRPMFKVGIDTGGDVLLTRTFTSGETETIKANQGFYVGGGVSVTNFHNKDLELEVSLTFKYTTAYGTSGEVDWTRYPLDALVFYRWPRMRAGGGLTYHYGPRLKGDGDAAGLNVKFENALGFALQADYRITEYFTVGVRYTAIEYETKVSPAVTTKSSGIGITLGMSF